jgi:hypothetical protein
MSVEWPLECVLPDLSGLSSDLYGGLMLSMGIGRGFPPGPAQFLVTEFVRTVEQVLSFYERARHQLEASSRSQALVGFVRACGELEIAYIVLNKAMRIGDAVISSSETNVTNAARNRLPSDADRARLTRMRNAIEHDVEPIRAGRGGQGDSLALEVRATLAQIADENGTVVATHDELARWLHTLHSFASELVDEPDEFIRT